MSAKYLLPCPCGQRIPVEPSQAGETVCCCCGATLEVPTMREIRQLKCVGLTAGARGAEGAWGKREALILLGAIVTATGLGVATYLQLTRPTRADVISLSSTATWALWQDLRRGVDRHLVPAEKYYIDALKMNRAWLYVTLTLAGLGMLLATISFLIPKRRIRTTATRKPRRARTAVVRRARDLRARQGSNGVGYGPLVKQGRKRR